MEIITWVTEYYDEILAVIGGAVTLASAIVKLSPTTKDDEILGKVIIFLEYFSIFNRKGVK